MQKSRAIKAIAEEHFKRDTEVRGGSRALHSTVVEGWKQNKEKKIIKLTLNINLKSIDHF